MNRIEPHLPTGPDLRSRIKDLEDALSRGERVEASLATALSEYPHLTELGWLADRVRRSLCPGDVATYSIGGAICVLPGEAKTPTPDGPPRLASGTIAGTASRLLARGCTDLLLYSDPDSPLSLAEWRRVLEETAEAAGGLTVSLPFAEIASLSSVGTVASTLREVASSGVAALRGEVCGSLRPVSWHEWRCLANAASDAGISFTAAIPIEQHRWVECLLTVRELQDRSQRIMALVTGATGLRSAGDPLRPIPGDLTLSAYKYLQRLAWSRLILDNVSIIQGAWETQGGKIGQVALRSGASDFGTTGLRGGRGGPSPLFDAADIERLILDAGFTPGVRDGVFQTVKNGSWHCGAGMRLSLIESSH